MSNQQNYVPFPDPMATQLRQLEEAKQHIIVGFLYALGLKNKQVQIANDLSGIVVSETPVSNQTTPEPTIQET